MTKGDIVVCVVLASHDYWSTTGISYGKQYEVLGTLGTQMRNQYYDNFITISNDHGIISDYKLSNFVPLSEWREEKLNEIGLFDDVESKQGLV